MRNASTGKAILCKNNHVVHLNESDAPKRCPVCSVRMRAAHPFLMGIGVGFLAVVLVSLLELSLLSWIDYSAWGPCGPFRRDTSRVSGGRDCRRSLHERAGYGNFRGIGSYLTGVGGMVVLFGVLWFLFLILVSIMMCLPDC